MRRYALLFLALIGSAANARTITDEQAWINVVAMGSVSGRLLYLAEFQPRFGAGDDRFRQLIVRPALGWQISDTVMAHVGYVRVETDRRGSRATSEDRGFQQLLWTIKQTPIGELTSRTRLEQRRRNDGDDTGWRVRQMLRTEVPLGRDPRSVRPLFSLEAFVALNDTDWNVRSGFDQLRSFVGVEIPLRGRSTIEAGYLNQAVNQRGGNRSINHVASMSLFIRP